MSRQQTRPYTGACSDNESHVHSCRPVENGHPFVAASAIFILSDVRFVRDGLQAAFHSNPDFSTVICGATVKEALAAEGRGVVLLDAVFPGAEDVAQTLVRSGHYRQLIVLAIEEETATVVRWARLGAAGYVPRHASLRQVLDTVKGVIHGEQICAPAVANGLIRHISAIPSIPSLNGDCENAQFTTREAEILPLLGAGSSNKDIARRLNIEVATVKCHVHNILSKLLLQRRGQVAHWIQAQRVKRISLHADR